MLRIFKALFLLSYLCLPLLILNPKKCRSVLSLSRMLFRKYRINTRSESYLSSGFRVVSIITLLCSPLPAHSYFPSLLLLPPSSPRSPWGHRGSELREESGGGKVVWEEESKSSRFRGKYWRKKAGGSENPEEVTVKRTMYSNFDTDGRFVEIVRGPNQWIFIYTEINDYLSV